MARTVRIELVVDADGAVRGVRTADGSFRRLENRVDKTGRKLLDLGQIFNISLGNIIADFAARAVASIDDVTRAAFDMSTTIEETNSRFKTVFGDLSGTVDEFGQEFAHMAGLTQNEFRDLATVTGSIMQGMGANMMETVENTETIIRLAGDLASFHEQSIEDTFAAVRSGITGESEPLKRFGIIVREQAVADRALAESAATTSSELTEWERVQARLNIILEQSGVVLGDLERTQDSASNTARRLSAELREQWNLLAQGLLPTFALVLEMFENLIQAAGEDGAAGVIQAISIFIFDLTAELIQIGQAIGSTAALLLDLAETFGLTGDQAIGFMQPLQMLREEIQGLNEFIARLNSGLNQLVAMYYEAAAAAQDLIGANELAAQNRETAAEFAQRARDAAQAFFDQKNAADATRESVERHRQELLQLLENLGELGDISDDQAAALARLQSQMAGDDEEGDHVAGSVAKARKEFEKLQTTLADLQQPENFEAMVRLRQQAAAVESRIGVLQRMIDEMALGSPEAGGLLAGDDMELDPDDLVPVDLPAGVEERMQAVADAIGMEIENIKVTASGLAVHLGDEFGEAADAIQQTMGTAAGAFRQAFESGGRESRAFFRLWKAAAIAEATVSTYNAANRALASAPPPFNYGLAAAVVGAGLANVAAIAGTEIGGGGAGEAGQARGQDRAQSDVAAGIQAGSLPRRARGGRVFAGQPFLAGEAGPEPVFPMVDGFVVDNNTFNGMGGSAAQMQRAMQALNVKVDVMLQNEITAVDIFELRTQINRVERFINEGAGS